jgi:ATP-dependent Clp protease ATP-binding subunit ClpA
MFERFTSRARHAVVLAQEEARRLDHKSIGTEHVLLGLLGEPEATAGRVLGQLGITLPAARADVEGLVGRGDGAPGGHIPFTPQAKKVLELSLREALALGHNYIGTEHILLGLVREGEGAAVAVLAQRGATGPTIRALVQTAVSRAGAGSSAIDAPAVEADRRTEGAEAVIAAARQLAGSGPMGSHHLLQAMTLVDDSLASGALVALGVAPDALAATIDDLGTTGTSDLSPEEAGARQMELRVTDDVTIVLRDVTSVELGRRLSTAIGNPITGASAGSLVGIWQANVAALQDLVERVDPKEDDEPGSRAAIVRAAIRHRLRRRTGGG